MHCTLFFRKLVTAAAIGTVFSFTACSPAKNLTEGQYFFTGYKIKYTNKTIDKEELHTFIRQKPNRKFFFLFRLQLGFYRLGEGLNSAWLKNIGEEPVVLDTTLIHHSTNQLGFFMSRKGYFNAVVKDTIIYKKKKARVIYSIEPGIPYKIKSVTYESADSDVNLRLEEEKKNSLIRQGMIYDEDVLDKERERFTDVMKSKGYYFFTKQFITYTADSALQTNEINLKMSVSRLREDTAAGSGSGENHHRYYLHRIFITTDYDPKSTTVPVYDTVSYKNYFFLVDRERPEPRYRRDVILGAIFISTGDLFNINDVQYSYSRLTDLNVFRFVNIRFDEVPRNDIQQHYLLDVSILLTPLRSQDFTVETEGTHNAGNLGIAGNVGYRNRNTFKGAELLQVKLKGGLEFQKTFSEEENITALIFNTFEIGPEVSLNLKKLLLIHPVFRNSSRKWNPRTRISTAVNYQERPDYNRSVANLNLRWQIKTTLPHIISFDLFDINSVDVQLSPSFVNKLNQINDKGLFYSYNDHLITSGRVGYIYNNQEELSRRNFDFLQVYWEFSGWLLSLMGKPSFIEEDSLGFRKAFGLTYSQYNKFEIDFRHYQNFAANNILVYRINLGVGLPRDNSIALPFEKSFYGGGSNSLRAWKFRSLGPGSYVNTFNIEQTGDFKAEANVELRSPLFRRLEGAVFIDAGNIWLLYKDNERIGGQLQTNKFVSEIAAGAGLGVRFNFTYFIFRLDGAVKLRDPSRIEAERWVYGTKKFSGSDINYNFGIGYPF